VWFEVFVAVAVKITVFWVCDTLQFEYMGTIFKRNLLILS